MKLNIYLSFRGNCEEAMNFYKECLGGTFESMKYFKDGPEEMGGHKLADDMKDKVMHMTWRFGGGNIVMASDGMDQEESSGKIKLSISMNDPDRMEEVFNKMVTGGQVIMAPEDTFWGAKFGMLTDKYGFTWMFNCEVNKS